ncbi:MAG TPA: TonB-dependent receptor [Vicinamibacterales bacterium]|nr:TonB-dependent receptor [Vicinamibacterales bacterium]
MTALLLAQLGASPGAIEGLVSTRQGGQPLPRADVVVVSDDAIGRVAARRTSDADGRFVVVGLAAGTYRISASVPGFATADATVVVMGGATARVALALEIVETISVAASSEVLTAGGSLAPEDAMASRELDQFVPGTGFQSAVRMFSSVVTSSTGLSIKGGRPNETGVQLGAGTLVDPASAIAHVALPDDAIDSVTVLPNPYDVEYGRFESGVVVIQTRRATERWHTQVNRVVPTIRNARGQAFAFRIDTLGPRLATGGPVIKDRLYIEQTGQLRYTSSDVPSRPESELRTSTFFSAFTRADANLSPRQSLIATLGVFPNRSTSTTLGTFTPPDATADVHAFAAHAAITARTLWSGGRASDTMVQLLRSRTDVLARGTAPMTLQPETTLGNFFNTQSRTTTSLQLVQRLTVPHDGPWGSHRFRIGADVIAAAYDGASDSRPVLIQRAGGTLARRLDYAGASRESVENVDLAAFAQDRIALTPRWNAELGARIDRDGVVDRVNVAPRIGTAVLLGPSGRIVLHGGVGLFYGRTPSVVGAFGSFTSAVDARYATDGVRTIGSPVLLAPVAAPGLETPRNRAWETGVEYRIDRWEFHATVVGRDGRGEFIVQPVIAGSTGALRLSSDGTSTYRDLEIGAHYTRGTIADVQAVYDFSSARGDLNALTSFFDALMAPVVGANAYAPLAVDVPHRLFVRGRILPAPRWLLLGTVDWRTGVPYSIVDEMLDFVGPRNDRRFPNYARLELGFQYRADIFRWKPWLGVRVANVFGAFLPSEVQANSSSPFFGTFYNSEDRHIRLQLRFER